MASRHPDTIPPTVLLLLTPPEAAKALAMSVRSLWSYTAAGAIQSVRLGRSVRYSITALERFIAEREAATNPAASDS
jgi:excisionase family DNA binding protein